MRAPARRPSTGDGRRSLVLEAIQRFVINLSDFNDHGPLNADIRAYLRARRVAFRHPLIRKIIPDVAAERNRTPEVAMMLDGVTAACRRD